MRRRHLVCWPRLQRRSRRGFRSRCVRTRHDDAPVSANACLSMTRSAQRRCQHHCLRDRRWREALEYALLAIGNSPYPRQWPAIRVLSMSDSGAGVQIELRFRAGERYCCGEPRCYLATYDAAWWHKLRAHLREVGDRTASWRKVPCSRWVGRRARQTPTGVPPCTSAKPEICLPNRLSRNGLRHTVKKPDTLP